MSLEIFSGIDKTPKNAKNAQQKSFLIRISMNKVAVSAFAAVLCWSSVSLYARHQIETAYPKQLAAFAKNNNLGLQVKTHTFDAGAFSSTANTVFEVKPNACVEQPILSFTVKEHLRHDLISGLGAVTSDIEIIINDEKVEKTFNGMAEKINKDLLMIKGTYSLLGNVDYDISSPLFNFNDNSNTTIDWGGMTAKITFNNDNYIAHFSIPRLTLSDNNNRNFVLSGFQLNQDGTQTAMNIDTGKTSFVVDSLELYGFKQGIIPNILVENLQLNRHTKINGNLIDIAGENNIGKIKIGKLIEKASMTSKISINHLDAQGLATFYDTIHKIQTTCKADIADYDTDLKAVLKGSPELVVEKLQLSMGDAAFGMSGHIKGVNLDKIKDHTLDALRKIDGLDGLDIKLQLSTNDASIAALENEDNSFAKMIGILLNANILNRQNNSYVLDIVYKNSELKFNDMSLNDLKLVLNPPSYPNLPQEKLEEEVPTTVFPDWYDPNKIY